MYGVVGLIDYPAILQLWMRHHQDFFFNFYSTHCEQQELQWFRNIAWGHGVWTCPWMEPDLSRYLEEKKKYKIRYSGMLRE